MTIPVDIEKTFIAIYERLQGLKIPWVLTGSLAFAIQGLPLTPKDIDIQTDREGAYAIEELFKPNITRPVLFSVAERIRSYFGELVLNEVHIEIMGDIQKRTDKDRWSAPVPLPDKMVEITYHGLKVPVLPIEDEIASYRKMGRHEQADQLEKWCRGED